MLAVASGGTVSAGITLDQGDTVRKGKESQGQEPHLKQGGRHKQRGAAQTQGHKVLVAKVGKRDKHNLLTPLVDRKFREIDII